MAERPEQRTYESVLKQISYNPMSRQKAASKAQLEYIAALIVKKQIRWDDDEKCGLTVWQAKNMIASFLQYPDKE